MLARFALVLLVAGVIMILTGCSDMGDPVKAVAPPVDAPVSYQNDVRPIFNHRGCLNVGCHGDGSQDITGMLSSYGNFVNRTSFGYAPAIIVKPSDPTASVLYNKIEDTRVYGQLMPFGGPQLPQAERDLIRKWVLEGAQNN